jgi:uncharacterized protein
MSTTTFLAWRDWEGAAVQHLVLREAPEGIVAEAALLGSAASGNFAATFRIVCDASWRARELEVRLFDSDRHVLLRGDGAGRWHDANGTPLPALDGAIDVDLPLTPFTNTLPIRRLALGAGASADLKVVYLTLPELSVIADPQRYVCLEPMQRYRYESLDSDFVREIEVDAAGLVLTYPGLFRRVSSG